LIWSIGRQREASFAIQLAIGGAAQLCSLPISFSRVQTTSTLVLPAASTSVSRRWPSPTLVRVFIVLCWLLRVLLLVMLVVVLVVMRV